MLIIDDYPSFVDTVPQAPIILRDLMETYRDHGKVFVLLMGTHVDELKGRILGESSLIAAIFIIISRSIRSHLMM